MFFYKSTQSEHILLRIKQGRFLLGDLKIQLLVLYQILLFTFRKNQPRPLTGYVVKRYRNDTAWKIRERSHKKHSSKVLWTSSCWFLIETNLMFLLTINEKQPSPFLPIFFLTNNTAWTFYLQKISLNILEKLLENQVLQDLKFSI